MPTPTPGHLLSLPMVGGSCLAVPAGQPRTLSILSFVSCPSSLSPRDHPQSLFLPALHQQGCSVPSWALGRDLAQSHLRPTSPDLQHLPAAPDPLGAASASLRPPQAPKVSYLALATTLSLPDFMFGATRTSCTISPGNPRLPFS